MIFLLNKPWFQALIVAILLFTLILLISYVDFIFNPIKSYLTAISVPIIGAGILYYITVPIVNLLQRYKVNRIVGIFIVFLLIIAVVFFTSNVIAPVVQQQFSKLVDNTPKMVDSVQEVINYWQNSQNIIPSQLDGAIQKFTDNLQSYVEGFTTFLIDFVAQLFGFVFALVLIPFFLFFMLKDGEKLVPFISQFLSKDKARSFKKLTENINQTLSSFIQGQLLVSLFVGIMLYIGYVVIRLDYALMLALIALILNVIPFAGPFLSAIPAVLVAFFQDPIMAVYVIIIMIVAQQIEGNLISPNVMGRALHLHPLTIITLVLSAGAIAGFLGLLFVIPAYAVIKTITSHFYEEWKKKQPADEQELF